MGVHGLWRLLEPSARAVRLEALHDKRLAVDASIWLHQFLKAMRTSDGKPLPGAHLQGFFRRICKLLYFGILPVFVFDGRTPELKKVALRKRRAAHRTVQNSLARTAHQLLVKQMQLGLVNSTADSTADKQIDKPIPSRVKPANNAKGQTANSNFFDDEIYYMDEEGNHIRARDVETHNTTLNNQEEPQNPLIDIAKTDDRLVSFDELRRFIRESKKDVDISAVNLDDESFYRLPVEVQHDIITELKLRSRMASNRRLETMLQSSADSSDFSKMQIKHLVIRNDLTQRAYDFAQNAGVTENPALKKRIEEAKKNKGYLNPDLLSKRRVAGERNTEYVFVAESLKDTTPAAIPGFSQPSDVDSDHNDAPVVDNEFFGGSLQNRIQRPEQKRPRVQNESNEDDHDRGYSLKEANKKSRKVVDISAESHPYLDAVKLDDYYVQSKESPVQIDDSDDSASNSNDDHDAILEQQAILESYKSNSNPNVRKIENGSLTLDDSDLKAMRDIAAAILPNADELRNKYLDKKGLCRYMLDTCIPNEYLEIDPSIKAIIAEAFVVWGVEQFEEFFAKQDRLAKSHLPKSAQYAEIPVKYVDSFNDLIENVSSLDNEEKFRTILRFVMANMYYKKLLETVFQWRRIHNDFKTPANNSQKYSEPLEDDDEFEEIDIPDPTPLRNQDDSNELLNDTESSMELFKPLKSKVSPKKDGDTAISLFDDIERDDEKDDNDIMDVFLSQSYDENEDIINISPTKSLVNVDTSVIPTNHSSPSPKYESKDVVTESLIDVQDPVMFEIHHDSSKDVKTKLTSKSPRDKHSKIKNAKVDVQLNSNDTYDVISPVKSKGKGLQANVISVTSKNDLSLTPSKSKTFQVDVQSISSERSLSPVKSVITPITNEPIILNGSGEEDVGTLTNNSTSLQDKPLNNETSIAMEGDNSTQHVLPEAEAPVVNGHDKSHSVSDDDDQNEDYLDYGGIDSYVNMEEEAEEFHRFVETVGKDRPIPHNITQSVDELERDILRLKKKKQQDELTSQGVNSEQIFEVQQLLNLFSIPYITAYTEAESQCAFLVNEKLVDGIITDDSDVFLFGGTNVYKNMFNQQKYVEEYSMTTINDKIHLRRENLIQLAYLLGSDYTEGVPGIGITNAIEILDTWRGEKLRPLKMFRKFCKIEKRANEPISLVYDDEDDKDLHIDETKIDPKVLKRLRKLAQNVELPSENFPDVRVYESYNNPVVNTDCTNFEWGRPNLDLVRAFMEDKGQMSRDNVDRILIPVVKHMDVLGSKVARQTNISSYITIQPKNVHHKSGRIDKVLTKWGTK